MNSPALIFGSILLFGCGTPYHLLIHNDLTSDAEFTVRWRDGNKMADDSVQVPRGRADEAYVGYSHLPERIDIQWREINGRTGKIANQVLPKGTYHAYVDGQTVRFEPKDWKDKLNDNFLWLTPVWWGCGLFVMLPTAIFLLIRRRLRARR